MRATAKATPVMAGLIAALALSVTGCGGSDVGPDAHVGGTPTPIAPTSTARPTSADDTLHPTASLSERRLPVCSILHGTDGSKSTLIIRQTGSDFTGTYDNLPAGKGVGVRSQITGNAKDGRFVSTWSLGHALLHVSGAYTPDQITLDNPGGWYSTTVFKRAGSCA